LFECHNDKSKPLHATKKWAKKWKNVGKQTIRTNAVFLCLNSSDRLRWCQVVQHTTPQKALFGAPIIFNFFTQLPLTPMFLLSIPDFASGEVWVSLLTLTFLKIVLGIDNIIFLSIVSAKLPEKDQPKARNIGLILAMGPQSRHSANCPHQCGLFFRLDSNRHRAFQRPSCDDSGDCGLSYK